MMYHSGDSPICKDNANAMFWQQIQPCLYLVQTSDQPGQSVLQYQEELGRCFFE